jgi:hypothetical protein
MLFTGVNSRKTRCHGADGSCCQLLTHLAATYYYVLLGSTTITIVHVRNVQLVS